MPGKSSLNVKPAPAGRRGGEAERKCMMCQKPFPSEGFHNRICKKCKSEKAYKSDI